MSILNRFSLVITPAVCTILSPLHGSEAPELKLFAESPYQWTGVAISAEERFFVNFPTWTVPSPYKVAELIDGKTVAYPDEASQKEFACVQSVVIDKKNRLWILDPAPRVMQREAKLFCVDLKTDKIVKTYTFPFDVASMKSYLNDVRVDTEREIAYITDSSLGGLVVLDLATGESWRALDHTVEAMMANLKEIRFASTEPFARPVHSDGIAISPDFQFIYVTALTGDILYRIPTAVLRDRTLSIAQRAKAISVENAHNVATDGMVYSDGKLYMGDLAAEGVWVYDLKERKGSQLKLKQTVRWADSFAVDKAGNIYFTTTQLNYPAAERISFRIYQLKK